MSYIITGATLLSYNHQNTFLNDAFRLNSTKDYTVEGFFLQQTNTEGVSGNLALESGLVRSLKEREEIIVNGINLGPARITSISFNSNNPVRLDTYTISFNVLTSGQNDLYNLTGNLYTGMSTALSGTAGLLETFDENFSFNLTEDNSYNYTQNLNIRYRQTDGYPSPIQLAKNLASGIFSTLPNIGFIDSNYFGFYTKSGKKFFTESYNLITNDCSFTKNFNIFNNNYSGQYTLTLVQSLNLGNDGNIDVSEQGNIRGLIGDRFTTAKNAAEFELIQSYNRCNSIFNTYKNSNQLTNSYNLLNTGIDITKNYNSFNGEAQYSVRYTNNPVFNALGYTKDTTLTLNENNLGIVDVQENGNVRIYGSKSANFSTTFDLSKINTIFSTAASNISSFYTSQGYANTLSLIEKNLSFPKYGQALNYSLRYSDDSIYNQGIAGIKKLTIKKTDNIPTHMYNQYIIPNKTTFAFAGGQTELGNRDVTLECVVDRPNGSIFSTNPITSTILNSLKSRAISELGKDFPNVPVEEAFITKCDYSFDSDLNLNFNIGINYSSFIGQFNSDIKIT